MMTELEIKKLLKESINKDGEGHKLGLGGKTYFEDTGNRLWEARENTFRKSAQVTKACSDVYVMDATEGQVEAYFIGGEVLIAHNGQERSAIGNRIRRLKKDCKITRKKS